MIWIALAFAAGIAFAWLTARLIEWADTPMKPEPRELGPNGYGYDPLG